MDREKSSDTKPFGRREHYLATFDGWRAIAALSVVFSHEGVFPGLWISPLWKKLDQLNPGPFGVYLFFALSGFLITYLMLVERNSTGTFHLSAFWIRRLCRIVPLAWSYILTLGLLTLCGFPQFTTKDLLPAVAFFYNYLVAFHFGGSGPLWHFWTLGVEMQFYLFWALAIWLTGCRRVATLSLVLAAVITAWRTAHHGTEINIWRTDFSADTLLMGALFGSIYFRAEGRALLRKYLPPWAVILILVGVVFVTGWKPHGDLILKPILYAALLTGTLLNSSHAAFRWLEWPVLTWLGRISFSIYVCQELFTGASLFHPVTPILLPVTLAALLILAWLSYTYIEVPGIRLGAQIIRRIRPTQTS